MKIFLFYQLQFLKTHVNQLLVDLSLCVVCPIMISLFVPACLNIQDLLLTVVPSVQQITIVLNIRLAQVIRSALIHVPACVLLKILDVKLLVINLVAHAKEVLLEIHLETAIESHN